MTRLHLKVCGLREPGNILEVDSLGVDYMGFIFFQDSPRYVGAHFEMPLGVAAKKVGVFVNEVPNRVIDLATRYGLSIVQLHGDESAVECALIRAAGLKVIKVLNIDSNVDFSVLADFEDVVDFFLFDTKGKLRGGNAVRFDWRLLERYNGRVPFFLSGGLDAASIQAVEVFEARNIHAVDLNSGVEITPGLKDVVKIMRIQDILKSFL